MYRECMLTTLDNPFDYFEQFNEWLSYDKEKGYNTCEYLARVANLSDDFSQKEEFEEIERAIDEILMLNPVGVYRKVIRNTEGTVVELDSDDD